MPKFREQLIEWIESKDYWRPNVRSFSLELAREIKPRPITRDLDWGIRVPVPDYDENPNKRIYVWVDAVVGYLSAAVEWAKSSGRGDAWRDWWQDPDARHVYFMGKDNIVFHTIIWPAELLGYGTGGELGAGRELIAAGQCRGFRVSEHGTPAVQRKPRRWGSCWAISWTGTTRTRSATT